MRNYLSNHKSKISTVLVCLFLTITSCEYKEIADAPFPPETVYLTTAAIVKKGADRNGLFAGAIYRFNFVDAISPSPRFNIDLTAGRFNILSGVQRGGVTSKGAVNINVVLNTDTITTLKSAGVLPSTTEILPLDKVLIPATLQMEDGSNSALFNIGLDMAFLRSNPNKSYAIGVTISSTDRTVTNDLRSVVILINTNILVPTADFTSTLNATTKTVSLVNRSLNWVNYTWDFGDNSPLVTAEVSSINNNNRVLPAITKTYAAAGTYNITLTAVGLPFAVGQINQSVKTISVIVP
ncbi:hypothetical protein A5893_13140 [Pedobacter psychrophilus]|uniref:PKD domain-containing protein n=1 Tax=Pedobacter psychrophilus TaxID=1826909 RepID=A0A179DD57_9SPHI|nr:PKD domain-containing protein [Pedobacter psychrophilus]OAQ38977.1 hypothetical protein A5893_13140 [Pedobacter psychrophilus]